MRKKPVPVDLHGKNAVITGASSGIGRVAAVELAKMGAKLFLLCRNPLKAEETREEVVRASGNKAVELLIGDLGVQIDVRRIAAEFLTKDQPLHILLNNAGVMNLKRQVTVDGLEEMFAINHLGYFLLTQLLLDRLKQSAPSRIINVASDAHKFGRRLDFDDLQAEKSFSSMREYGRSKLGNILYTYELARRLQGSGVTVNCLHPGAVSTGLGKNNGWLGRALIPLLAPFFRSAERGAETSIYLASSPEVAETSGQYFIDCKPRRSNRFSYQPEAAQRLWEVSARLTGLTPNKRASV